MTETATESATETETESAIESAVSPQQRIKHEHADTETDPTDPTVPTASERNTYRTVRELVQEMKAFRGRVADALHAAGTVDDERVRLFLDDLERRERERQELLDQLADSGAGGLETWRQNLPTQQLVEAIEEVDRLVEHARSSDEALDLEEVVASTLAVESHAAKTYRAVAESASAESTRELLDNLADLCEAAAADRAWAYHDSRQV